MCGSDMLYTFRTDRLAHFINTCFNQHRLPMLEAGRMQLILLGHTQKHVETFKITTLFPLCKENIKHED